MRYRNVAAVAGLLLVSACGGGGGGGGGGGTTSGGSPTPAPVPTPTPTPTPTPSPSLAGDGDTLFNPGVGREFSGFYGTAGYHRAPDGRITYVEGAGASPTFPARGNGRGISYVIRSAVLADFGRTFSLELDEGSSSSSYEILRGRFEPVEYELKRLKIGPDNPLAPLIYSNVAVFRGSYFDTTLGVTRVAVNPMSYGVIYDWQTGGVTGSAKYRGVVMGGAQTRDGVNAYKVTGTVEINFNYDTKRFTGQLQLVGENDQTGVVVSLGSIDIFEAGARNDLSSFTGLRSGGDMRLQGHFCGPLAQELVAGANTTVPDPASPGSTLAVTLTFAAGR